MDPKATSLRRFLPNIQVEKFRTFALIVLIVLLFFVVSTFYRREHDPKIWNDTFTIYHNGELDECVPVYGTCRSVIAGTQESCVLKYQQTCLSSGFSGICVNDECKILPLSKDSTFNFSVLGWETFSEHWKSMPFDTEPVVTIQDQEHSSLDPYIKRLMYWNRPSVSKTYKPIIPDRFLTTKIHLSGFNNRRMSLEMAYVMAFVSNRTLVLWPAHPFVPHNILGLEEKYWDLDGLKSGWPTLTWDEFRLLPNFNQLKPETIKWSYVTEGILAVPEVPPEGTPDYQHYTEWGAPRPPTWGTHYKSRDSQNFTHLYIDNELFNNFYLFFYPSPSSGIKVDQILRLVRDHFHFRKEVFELSARLLKELPTCFSTMHYRRGDLDYPTGKIMPDKVFNNTINLFYEKENLYVATDDQSDQFKDFLSIFSKRYNVYTFSKYSSLFDGVDPKWIPLIEILICTQGRIFVGTLFSTMTSYVHRLRGYQTDININKNFYFTSTLYNNPDEGQKENDLGWSREYTRGFRPIQEPTYTPDILCPPHPPLLQPPQEQKITTTTTPKNPENPENPKNPENPENPKNSENPENTITKNFEKFDDTWVHAIPYWETDGNKEILQNIENREKRNLEEFPEVVEFFEIFRFSPWYLKERRKNNFPGLDEFLGKLRENSRNMFVAPISMEGYYDGTSSPPSLVVRINVVWESPGIDPKSTAPIIYGARGDIGFVEFRLQEGGAIKDFIWRGLQIPPVFSHAEEMIKMDLKLAKFYDECNHDPEFFPKAYLSYGFYENAWLKWWGLQNTISAADVSDCFNCSIQKSNKQKYVLDNDYKCFKEEQLTWLNDQSYSIHVRDSESEECQTNITK